MNKSAVVIQATILVIVVAMSFQLWKLDTDLKVISSNQEQISPGTKRPMANGTRYALPPAIDTEIKNIEQQLGDSDKWPKDAESVRNLNERFVSAVDQLPPWAVDELGPRLLPRRWDIDALWLAKEATPVDVASLSDVAGTIAAHLEGKPQGVSVKIHKELLKRKDQIDKAERSAAIKSTAFNSGFSRISRMFFNHSSIPESLLTPLYFQCAASPFSATSSILTVRI